MNYQLNCIISKIIPIEQMAVFPAAELLMTKPPIFAFPPAYISFGHFKPRSSFYKQFKY